MDPGRTRDLNEAARRFAETLAESDRLVYQQASESGERQQEHATEFSELVASILERMDPPRALQPRPRALQHRRGLGERVLRVFNAAEIGYEKPHPEAYRRVVRILGD